MVDLLIIHVKSDLISRRVGPYKYGNCGALTCAKSGSLSLLTAGYFALPSQDAVCVLLSITQALPPFFLIALHCASARLMAVAESGAIAHPTADTGLGSGSPLTATAAH